MTTQGSLPPLPHHPKSPYTTPRPSQCMRPPEGWYCTLDAGHEGPCPTYPLGTRAAGHHGQVVTDAQLHQELLATPASTTARRWMVNILLAVVCLIVVLLAAAFVVGFVSALVGG